MSKHGFRYHLHYPRWADLISRCTNIKHRKYPDYGGRGIDVCPEWSREAGPKAFCEWADKTYISGLILDRRDNDRGYSPENCRWVDSFTSNNNRRLSRRKYDLPKGVYFHGSNYRAKITINNKTISLGTFGTSGEASKAYELSRAEWIQENTP